MRGHGDDGRIKQIMDNGLVCLARLHGEQTWEDWMGVGAALEVITEEALIAVGAAEWDANNKQAVKEFNRRWEAYEATAGDNHKPLSKQERWSLREVRSNPEVTAYRFGLTGPEKRQLNHPNAVINRWKRKKAKLIPEADKKPSAYAKLEAANIELQEENHRLKKAGDGSQFSKEDGAMDIANVITKTPHITVNKVRDIVRALNKWIKEQEAKPKPLPKLPAPRGKKAASPPPG